MYAKIVMANARMLVRGTYEPDEKLDGEVRKAIEWSSQQWYAYTKGARSDSDMIEDTIEKMAAALTSHLKRPVSPDDLKRPVPEGGDSVDEARLWKMVDELLADKKILQREKEELRAQLAEMSRLLEEARSQLQAPAKSRGTGTKG